MCRANVSILDLFKQKIKSTLMPYGLMFRAVVLNQRQFCLLILGNSYLILRTPAHSAALGWCGHCNKNHYISLVVQEPMWRIAPEIRGLLYSVRFFAFPRLLLCLYQLHLTTSWAKTVLAFSLFFENFYFLWVLSCSFQSFWRLESTCGPLTLWTDLPCCHQILTYISWIKLCSLFHQIPLTPYSHFMGSSFPS